MAVPSFWTGDPSPIPDLAFLGRDKVSGGLGVKNIRAFNLALLGKWLWHLASTYRSLWAEAILSKQFSHGSWSDFIPDASYNLSSIWKGILLAPNLLRAGTWWRLGNGFSCRFWLDRWCNGNILGERFPSLLDVSGLFSGCGSALGLWWMVSVV